MTVMIVTYMNKPYDGKSKLRFTTHPVYVLSTILMHVNEVYDADIFLRKRVKRDQDQQFLKNLKLNAITLSKAYIV